MTSKAASRIVIERGSRHSRASRFAAALAARSSALRCLAHCFVTASVADFIAEGRENGLVGIGPSADDDGRLASVREFDPWAGEVHDKDYRLGVAGPLFGKDGFQALTVPAERTERIAETDAPIGAGNDPTTIDATGAIAERGLKHAGEPILTDAENPLIFSALGMGSGAGETSEQMSVPDYPKRLSFDRLAVAL